MLVVYAGLFGVSSLAIPKWSIALLALLSTAGGWWWQTRRPRGECGCDSGGPEGYVNKLWYLCHSARGEADSGQWIISTLILTIPVVALIILA